MKSIFLFTRDLRLTDNTGLIECSKKSKIVIPIFIFNPDQVTNRNKYKSNNCIQFMCESLADLNKQLKEFKSKLFFFFDHPHSILDKLIEKYKIQAIFINKDYTPFAKKREQLIQKICNKHNITFASFDDYLLNNNVMRSNGDPYMKFTPYHRIASQLTVKKPINYHFNNFISSRTRLEYEHYPDNLYIDNPNINVHGGRSNALHILNNIKQFKDYSENRNFPTYQTTQLSAYLKFNVVSIREVYHCFKKKLNLDNTLFTQLYWRDFFTTLVFHFPYVIGSPMKESYNIKWKNNKNWFNKWKTGMTGFPIVDAGMRQMNKTGWMHNRLRLITSNFLIKILQIDWMFGEKYFAQSLVDYDISLNNSNWQWSASTGADSQPYFRIFNPWRQSEKFDRDAIYIKKWIPELSNVSNKDIHNWFDACTKYKDIDYPSPIIINISKQIKSTVLLYKHRS